MRGRLVFMIHLTINYMIHGSGTYDPLSFGNLDLADFIELLHVLINI